MVKEIEALKCAWKRTPKEEKDLFKQETLMIIAAGVAIPVSVAAIALATTQQESQVGYLGLSSGISVGVFGIGYGQNELRKIKKRYDRCLKEVI
jgi:hypothetical protein